MIKKKYTYIKDMNTLKRGDIIWINMDSNIKAIGSEQEKSRPAVIIQNNIGNKHSPCIIVAYLTGSIDKAKLPTHVKVIADMNNGLLTDSIILCEQLYTFDKKRVLGISGILSKTDIILMNKSLRVSLDI